VQIEVDDRPISFQYLGKEVEMDVTWCYAEISDVPNLKKITVSNTLLLDLYDEQTNIVHIKAHDKKKSMMLNIAKSADTVTF
jgi:hypothetical protein